MVIHHFNRIIKNKWVWGVFAVLISTFFAFDFLFTGDSSSRSAGSAGMMDGKDVAIEYFQALKDDARGFGRNRNDMDFAEVNKAAWISATSLAIAEKLGIAATDEDIRQVVRRQFSNEMGQFDFNRYEMIVRGNLGMTTTRFEEGLRRRLTIEKVRGVLAGSASWVSPVELEMAINDVTDKFTIRIADFRDKDAAKTDLTEEVIKTYYEENTNSLALPELMTVRYIKFQADATNRLAQFTIEESALQDHYSATSDRFESTDTNGVTVTKSLDEVKPQLIKELQLIASLEAYRTNLPFRVYTEGDIEESKKPSKLDEIAKEEGLKVQVSKPFSVDNAKYVPGLMVRPTEIVPGRSDFTEVASRLDPELADLRYGVVSTTNAVYLIERASLTPARIPTLAEAREHIKKDALVSARAKAFKAAVEKKRALIAADLAAGKAFDSIKIDGANVSTAITYSVSSLRRASFPDSSVISGPVMKLSKGQLSDFIATHNNNRALLVYVENREVGNAAEAEMLRSQLRDELSSMTVASTLEAWEAANLELLDVQTTSMSTMENESDDGSVQ